MFQSKSVKSIFSKIVLLLILTSMSFSLSYGADSRERDSQRKQTGSGSVAISDNLWSEEIVSLTWEQRLENSRAQLNRFPHPHENVLQTGRLERVAVLLELPIGVDAVQDRVEIDLQAGVVGTLYHLLDLLNPSRYAYDLLRVQHVQSSLIPQLYRLGRFRYEMAAVYVGLAKRFTHETPPEREGPLEVSAGTIASLPIDTREPAKKWLDYILNHYHLRNNGDIPQIFDAIKDFACDSAILGRLEKNLAGFLSNSHLMQLEYLRVQRLGLPTSIEFGFPYLLPFQNLSTDMPYDGFLKAFIEEGWLTQKITPKDYLQIERFYKQFTKALEYQRIGEFVRTVLSPLEDIVAAPLGRALTEEEVNFICRRLYLVGAATVFDRIPKILFQREESGAPQNNVALLRRFIPFTQLRNIALVLHNANQLTRPKDRELLRDMLIPLVAGLKDLLPYMRRLVKEQVVSITNDISQQPLLFNLEDERIRHEDAFGRIKKVGQFGSDVAIFSKLLLTLDEALLSQFQKPLTEWTPTLKKAFVRIFVMLGESSKNLSNRSKLWTGSDKFWEKLSGIRDGIVHPSTTIGDFTRERLEVFLDNADATNNAFLQNMLTEAKTVLARMKVLYEGNEFTIESAPNIGELPEGFGEHVQFLFDRVRNLEVPLRAALPRHPELIDVTELTFEPRVGADVAALDNTFNLLHYQDQLAHLQELVRTHNFNGDFDALIEILPFDEGKKQEVRATKIRYQKLRELISEMISLLEREPTTVGFTESSRQELRDFMTPEGEIVEPMVNKLKGVVDKLPDEDVVRGGDDDLFATMGYSIPHPLKEKFEDFIKKKKAFKVDVEKCKTLNLKQWYEIFRDELLDDKTMHEDLKEAALIDFIEEAIEKEKAVREGLTLRLKRFGIKQNQHVELWFFELKKHYGLLLNSSSQRKRTLQKLSNSTLRLEANLSKLQHTTEDARKGEAVADIGRYWTDSAFCLALEDDFEGLRHKIGGLSNNLDSLYEIHPAIAAMLQLHLENLRRLGNDLGHLGDVHGFSTQSEQGKRYYLRRTLKIIMGEVPKGSISFIEALQGLRADLRQFIQKNDSIASAPFGLLAHTPLKNGDILKYVPVGGGAEPSRQFNLELINPDGNCGFNALGIPREVAVIQLLAQHQNETIRAAVAEDIRQALLQGHLPFMMRTANTNGLRAEYFHIQNQIDELRRHLGNIAPNITTEILREEALRIQPLNPQRAQLLSQLAQAIHNQSVLEGCIRDYIHNQEIYRQFVREEFGRGAWLSYVRGGRGTLYALALINNINVHIWQQNAAGILEEIPLAPGLVGAERHLFHTNGLTHFHRLTT